MEKKFWNIYDHPEIKGELDKFVNMIVSWFTNERMDKNDYKKVYGEAMKWIRSEYNVNQIVELNRSMNKSYKEFNGITETKPSFIKEDTKETKDTTQDIKEREVIERAWERFKEYTAESAKKNGRLKQGDNSKVWQWLRNNGLENFSCSTDIYSLPDKVKKLIVKACNYKLDGVSVTIDEEAGKKIINLDYLDEVCAGCYKLF